MSIKADNRLWRLIKRLEELRNTLKDKKKLHKDKKKLHLEFLGASEQLMKLLDDNTKPDPEDS